MHESESKWFILKFVYFQAVKWITAPERKSMKSAARTAVKDMYTADDVIQVLTEHYNTQYTDGSIFSARGIARVS